jgi:type I restriction enzyme M protein
MNTETHRQLANDIWSICNLLRGPYKRNEYRKVILPLTVLRRFDCLLAPTKAQALITFNEFKSKPESIIRSKMQAATGYPFYNLSKLELRPSGKDINSLLDDPSNLAPISTATSMATRPTSAPSSSASSLVSRSSA